MTSTSLIFLGTVAFTSAYGALGSLSHEMLSQIIRNQQIIHPSWIQQSPWANNLQDHTTSTSTQSRQLKWIDIPADYKCNNATFHPCKNGGTCNDDGTCTCQENWVDPDCSRMVMCYEECQAKMEARFKAMTDKIVCKNAQKLVVPCQEIRIYIQAPFTAKSFPGVPEWNVYYRRLVYEVNAQQIVLPGYKVVLTVDDSRNEDERMFQKPFEAMYRGGGPNAFAGVIVMNPPESRMMCNNLGKIARLPTVCCASDDILDDPKENPFINTYFGPAQSFFQGYTEVLRKLKWNTLGLLYKNKADDFKRLAKENGFSMPDEAVVRVLEPEIAELEAAWIAFDKARTRVLIVEGEGEVIITNFLCYITGKGVRGLTVIVGGWMAPRFDLHDKICVQYNVTEADRAAAFSVWMTGTIPLWISWPDDSYKLDCMPHLKPSELMQIATDDVGAATLNMKVFPEPRGAGLAMDQACALLLAFKKYLITEGKPLSDLYDQTPAVFQEMVQNLKNTEFNGITGQPVAYRGTNNQAYDFYILKDGAVLGYFNGFTKEFAQYGEPKWDDGTEGFENAPPDLYVECAEGEVRRGVGCAGCPPGTYYLLNRCLPCAAGTATASEGSTKCDVCQAGTYAGKGSTECQACPEGTAPGKAGQEFCPCNLGWFSSTGDNCQQCPDPYHTTSYLAATDENECLCQEDYYFKPGKGCVECGEGLVCPVSNDPPTQAAGYSVEVMNAEQREYSVYECFLDAAACPAGSVGECDGGSSGRMCLECPSEPDRMYWSTDKHACVKCGESGGGSWIFPVALVCLLAVMVFLYLMALPKPGNEIASATVELATTAALLLLAFQTVSVYSRLDIDWGEPLTSILNACRIFALDFGFLHLDCSMDATYASVFVLGTFFPALVAVTYAFAAFILSKMSVHDAPLRCWNAVGQLLQGLFTSFLMHGIKPFLYYTHPNGKKSMVSGPEVLLDSEEHSGLATCGVIHLCFYGGGFLAYCAYAIFQLRKRARGQDSRGVKAVLWYHFFVFKFKPKHYYFGILMLLRSTSIVLTPVIFPTPHSQIIVLQFVLCAYMVVQTILWPYRYAMHNYADIATSAVMIALTTAGAFFLEIEDGNANDVVTPVVVFLACSCLVYVVVLGVPFCRILSRACMSQEQRTQHEREQRKLANSFLADLQNMEKEKLALLQKKDDDGDIVACCNMPEVDIKRENILTSTVPRPGEEPEIKDFMAPLEHGDMKRVHKCLAVLEAKLIHRAHENIEVAIKKGGKGSNAMTISLTSARPAWSDQEIKQVKTLVQRVQTFMQGYTQQLLGDDSAIRQLHTYVSRLEQQFRGVYAACVRDILQPQPGFDQALGLARALQRKAADDEVANPPSWNGKQIDLMTVASTTQEAVLVYVKGVAAATQGTSPWCAMKHLYRILEKQALDAGAGSSDMPVWDAARSMVVYDSMEGILNGLERIKEDHLLKKIRIRRIKERFSEPTGGGWADILINYEFPDPATANTGQQQPLVCEMQLVHVRMLVLRTELGGHDGYVKYRAAREILDLYNKATSGTKTLRRSDCSQPSAMAGKPEPPKEKEPVLAVMPGCVGS